MVHRMEPNLETVNDYLVSVFNDILTIEESELKKSQFNDLSITEMHTIHQHFHREMVKNILKGMEQEEEQALLRALKNLHDFLQEYK